VQSFGFVEADALRRTGEFDALGYFSRGIDRALESSGELRKTGARIARIASAQTLKFAAFPEGR